MKWLVAAVAIGTVAWQRYVLSEADKWAAVCPPRLTRLNDGYCDCADGRDEPRTGACDTWFSCEAAIVEPFRVSGSFVGDGIQDCCDGSDEGLSDEAACVARAEVRVAELERSRATAARAAQRRADLAVVATQKRAKAYETITQYPWMRQQLQDVVQAEPAVFGGVGEWLALRGTCFASPPLTEKQTLGGTSNIEIRTDVFEFCPLVNVTQLVRGRDPVPLGRFRAWIDVDLDTDDLLYAANRNLTVVLGDARKPRFQLYDGAAPCPGAERHVLVRFVCADDHAVIAVHEDGLCRYLLTFATPLACNVSAASDALADAAIRLIQKRMAHATLFALTRRLRRASYAAFVHLALARLPERLLAVLARMLDLNRSPR